MRKRRKQAAVCTGALLLTALLCSCGAARSGYRTGTSAETMAAASDMVMEGGASDEAAVSENVAAEPDEVRALSEEQLLAAAAGTGAEAQEEGSGKEAPGSNGKAAVQARKLIRNLSLDLETKDYDVTLASVKARTAALGGYLEREDSYAPGGSDSTQARNASMTVRIPSEQVDTFLETALGNAVITRKSENTKDITLQYADTEAREQVLRIEQQRLMELLAEAQSTDSLIALEQRLSEIRYEIESLSSQLRLYDNQVSYSRIDLYIAEVKEVRKTEDDGFMAQLSAGLRENFDRMQRFCRSALLSFLVGIPFLLPLAAVLILVYSILKLKWRFFKKSPKAKERREADTQHADDAEGKTEFHRS